MKILAINGSHRKGNIEFMLNILLDSAEEVEIIELRNKKINFCSAGDDCCSKTGKCETKDDLLDIYPKLEKADIIILASPTYFSNVSARMKNFMDRCNPYWFNKKLKGKKVFLLGTGGNEESVKEMIRIMKTFTRILEMKLVGSYCAVANKRDGLKENKKVIKELQNIRKELS